MFIRFQKLEFGGAPPTVRLRRENESISLKALFIEKEKKIVARNLFKITTNFVQFGGKTVKFE